MKIFLHHPFHPAKTSAFSHGVHTEKASSFLLAASTRQPLFTKFQTSEGEKYVWTTFSTDQIDLNYNNPEVLFSMLEVLKKLILKGIKIIRLDAVGYAWKELGTASFHHPKTFILVELFREYAKSVDPSVRLLAEVVDQQSVADKYLGAADLVYDFRPGSATLYALELQKTEALYRIDISSKRFAVLTTHDGTSLNSSPLILTERKLISKGKRGYRTVMGKKIAYELESSFRYLAKDGFYVAHAYLLFCFQRCGIYYRSLHYVKNNYTRALKRNEGRSLNRGNVIGKKYDEKLLALIKIRHITPVIEFGHSLPIKLNDALYCCLRYTENGESAVIILNFSAETQTIPKFKGLYVFGCSSLAT
jgi:sucrose phosphorylase